MIRDAYAREHVQKHALCCCCRQMRSARLPRSMRCAARGDFCKQRIILLPPLYTFSFACSGVAAVQSLRPALFTMVYAASRSISVHAPYQVCKGCFTYYHLCRCRHFAAFITSLFSRPLLRSSVAQVLSVCRSVARHRWRAAIIDIICAFARLFPISHLQTRGGAPGAGYMLLCRVTTQSLRFAKICCAIFTRRREARCRPGLRCRHACPAHAAAAASSFMPLSAVPARLKSTRSIVVARRHNLRELFAYEFTRAARAIALYLSEGKTLYLILCYRGC